MAVGTAGSYLGKTRGQELLVVAGHHPAGDDEAAWHLPGLAGWLAALSPTSGA